MCLRPPELSCTAVVSDNHMRDVAAKRCRAMLAVRGGRAEARRNVLYNYRLHKLWCTVKCTGRELRPTGCEFNGGAERN